MNETLSAAGKAFGRLSNSEALTGPALLHLEQWLSLERYRSCREQLLALIAHEQWSLLLDSFARVLPFGTGGQRGAVGLGPNRMNPWTVGRSVQGHVDYLRSRFREKAALTVVLAYDVRCFRDQQELFVREVSNPVIGCSSRSLAELAARIYIANGIQVVLQSRQDGRFMSTPELSYAVRFYGAAAGLNVSASHNPPDDNGIKFYNEHGGQLVPPNDEALIQWVAGVQKTAICSWEEATSSELMVWMSEASYQAYVAAVAGQGSVNGEGFPVVFTGLHGAGTWSVPPVLRAAGFDVREVPEQAVADGQFSSVPMRAPNPEIPGCLERATEYADSVGADIVFGTDPDADRIGAGVRVSGHWRFLTGNEIATLVVYRALNRESVSRNAIVMRTEVTTSLVSLLAQKAGVQVVDHLLVGFKYIGHAIHELERTGEFAHVRGTDADFLVGVEESHGVLTSSVIRDKDAAGGALLLVELHLECLRKGTNLSELLASIWLEHGYVANRLVSTVMRGIEGRAQMDLILQSLRDEPPSKIGDRKIIRVSDRLEEGGAFGPIGSETERASRNVLTYETDDHCRIIVRKSGTEPKCKLYGEIRRPAEAGNLGKIESVTQMELADRMDSFLVCMLERVNIEMPDWGHQVSDLLPVDTKVAFSTEWIPQFIARVEAGKAPDKVTIQRELNRIGIPALSLVRNSVHAWMRRSPPSIQVRESVSDLFSL